MDPGRLRTLLIVTGLALAGAVGIIFGMLIAGNDDDGRSKTDEDDAGPPPTMADPFGIETSPETTTPYEPPDPQSPQDRALLEPRDPECPDADNNERHLQWTESPPMCIDPDTAYTATLKTSRGDIHIELDTDNAPVTSNNFVFLSRWGYYDGVEFHIVFPGDSAQAGDPIGEPPGTGGPGYTFDDEFLPEDENPPYPLYSVAMGNAGPDTNADIFFIMTGTEAESPPTYSRFGHVTDEDSQAVVDAIDATGIRRAGHDGTPSEPTIINTVNITES